MLAYVQKFATTEAHARRLQTQKIDRAVTTFGVERAPLLAALEEALALGLRYGFVDDARFAEVRARKGLRRGLAPGRVSAALSAKGVGAGLAKESIAAVSHGDPVREACEAYARRKRLGNWRPPAERSAAFTTDLAKLGRAGFPYAVARAVLLAPDPSEAESEPD